MGHFVRPPCGEQHQRGCIGGTEYFRQQCCTVSIAPLQIVDCQHQWGPISHASEQFPKGEGRPATQLLLAGDLTRPGRCFPDGSHLLEHRKQPGQRPHVTGQKARYIGVAHARQAQGQGVDDAVQRLERDRLALVAAPPQHDGFGVKRLDEAIDEGALADPRRAADVHCLLPASSGLAKRFPKCAELGGAPNEDGVRRPSDWTRLVKRRFSLWWCQPQKFLPAAALRRVCRHQ